MPSPTVKPAPPAQPTAPEHKAAPEQAAGAQAVPVALHIGHLNHVSRADAMTRVEGLIRRQSIVPGATYYRLDRTAGGFAYEIQEGGGRKAYLPTLLKRLRDQPDALIHLRAGNRVVRVQGGAEGIVSVVLPEEEQPPVDDIKPSGRMRPFEATGNAALYTASIFFGLGAVALVCAMLVTSIAASYWEQHAAAAASVRVDELPMRHWPSDQRPGTYVSRVQYVGGQWSVQKKQWQDPQSDNHPDLPDIDLRPSSDRTRQE